MAHPDDDAYGVAALVALHKDDPDFRFFLVHATDGEGGAIAEGSGATPETLGAVRREEDRRAWIAPRPYAIPARVVRLSRRRVGRRAVAPSWSTGSRTILDEERPDVVATFGPDGITGHPDHITIGQATTEAFLRLAGGPGPGLRRLTYGAIRQSVIDKWNRRRVAAGLEPWDPTIVYHLRGVPDERIDIAIDTSAVAPLVRRAMLEHRTQWNDMNNPAETDADKVKNVSRETQVIAWPPTRPGRLLSDVFEDLW